MVLLVVLMLLENGVALCSPWLVSQFSEVLLYGNAQITFNYRQILIAWLFLIALQCLLSYVNKIISAATSEKG